MKPLERSWNSPPVLGVKRPQGQLEGPIGLCPSGSVLTVIRGRKEGAEMQGTPRCQDWLLILSHTKKMSLTCLVIVTPDRGSKQPHILTG